MQYVYPYDQVGKAQPGDWQNAAPSAGVQGSILNAAVFPALQNEILNAIKEAGLAPSAADVAQLMRAIRSGQMTTFTDQGGVNALVIAPLTAHTALIKGLPFRVFPAYTNTIADPPLTLGNSGLSAKIRRRDGSALAPGDIIAGAPFDAVYDGAYFRILGFVASDINTVIGSSTSVSQTTLNLINSLTPRGSTKLPAFTGGLILNDIAQNPSYSVTQTTGSFHGASYADIAATCALRDLNSTGAEGSGTARIAVNNLTDGTTSYSNYVGGGAYYQNTQIPLVIPRVIVNLDSTKTYNIALALQKGMGVGQTQSYDAYIFVQHDGANN